MTEAFYNHLAKTRHQIHQHPEVSEEEHETTVFLKGYLKNLGIEPLNYPLKTGLVAEIGSGHPIIALRADIDALPIKEKTGLPYASNNGAMHACGHDFHQTSLLGAAQLLKEREAELKGTVRLIFQPAEENFQGAYQVIEAGGLAVAVQHPSRRRAQRLIFHPRLQPVPSSPRISNVRWQARARAGVVSSVI